jgi:HPt (histidine-containing phosphotransfer) domain-containing protein
MTMTEESDGKVPELVDPAVLEQLWEELNDDSAVWRTFVLHFISLLPDRLERLRLTLTTGDMKGAMDTVLSIKTSSQMVGAERLAELALTLEQCLREEPAQSDPGRFLPRLAVRFLKPMRRCAQQTQFRLHQHLRPGPPGG